ncbi:MAG: FAD:protein FMN transferase, partial [Leptospirales bacterium]|nr:FAD:protein FMN transferase [Leptospirales bacterium]
MKKILVTAMCCLFCSCAEKTHKLSFPAMGTLFHVTLTCSDAAAARIYKAVSDEVRRIESLMSLYDEKSDVYILNNSGVPVQVSDETYDILGRSVKVSIESGGAFDITFVPLGELWDYKNENFVPPSESAIKKILPLVNYRNILFHGNNTVSFAKNEMKIGLGAIAKGYAVEQAVKIMKAMNLASGIADAGGNLKTLGASRVIGVQHPREDSVICSVVLNDGEAVSTSGDYERYVLYNGRRYHHILNPATGFPAESFASV